MIDYLEPLLRTPQALTQAVAELEDSRLRPQRREGGPTARSLCLRQKCRNGMQQTGRTNQKV